MLAILTIVVVGVAARTFASNSALVAKVACGYLRGTVSPPGFQQL